MGFLEATDGKMNRSEKMHWLSNRTVVNLNESSISWFLEIYEVCKPDMKKLSGGGGVKLTSALAQADRWGE
jgi:uncharacterized membrane protein YfbV (UPF0208 family)